ncbi:hypothetical protein HPG69_016448 [Diceros bicornis minor]|uniref:NADH dehydrogenase [ubiquinone] 1 beta subcomplex subunit 2, mitochondrial n=1 Tax=Diceros bicornis minor TaxID=77932 RepID=A0A7J7EFM3_DICBM|nr:hypothetical protein HPG69_016448 [Diceros bicornis minor]
MLGLVSGCHSEFWRTSYIEDVASCSHLCFVSSAGGGVHIPPRYRQFPQLTRSQVIQGEFFSGIMWFWILWRFWHDSEAVLGHFPYPDPSQWTDEELGILPDDED